MTPARSGRLQDRVAIVTGSTRGIGRAIAEVFASEGAAVVINSRDPESARAVADEIGEGATGIAADISTESGCDDLFARTLARYGRLDVLVNNAGTSIAGPAEELALEDWERILALDLTAPFLCCQRAARHMLETGKGAIVNIASVAAFTTPPRRISYVTAKAGLVAMTKALAAEWSPRIRVNAVVPGYFETDLVAELIETGVLDRRPLEERTPYGRLGRPKEAGYAALFLASDDAEYITGATLPVDGGWLVYGHGV